MDYAFENLGDERFQEFCQALITKEFPDTQVYPTGQPDGGRDSISYFTQSSSNSDFFVFQIKYVKNPLLVKDVHKWLLDTLKDEVPKIDKLIPRGAKKYYLITNVKGTSHLDVGSIDKMDEMLRKDISIPVMCWWRDDLSRRIENNIDLKWSYAEILNGQDVLNSLLFSHINEFKERRETVIRAYLADQYTLDNKVKFRQVDLQNRLLDLFTDVPIKLKKFDTKNKRLRRKMFHYSDNYRFHVNMEDSFNTIDENRRPGAAEFLLSSNVQNEIERILLEGGPGQGKSTISQYISQIHRINLLNKTTDIALIPSKIKNTSIRLPFKIDLRHVASWVENKNPYPTQLSDELFGKIWQKSLESFMLGHILHHSQLDGFDRNDLMAIFKLSPILLVFDGFDEIANIKIREEVIELIDKGLDRIKENCKSIQVIITSRPAAFVDSISFSVDNYPHFELTDITPEITKEYVDKWIKASRLDSREAAEIRRLVEEKLGMPHLRDLAKSPMQLAIFISLLRKKGESLPNKRTAMYDNYIELFFDRESEKSTIIRDNRDLIIDIHEYLGWILHSEAELYKNSGSIEINNLKLLLKEYLQKEGHQTDITDKLFDVVKERVCALASRVQGTFEFEVQPLREYFCAKYLYKTSPYSPVGAERTGTKPERFEAISINYYWQNTVRFFAGCFDKGELPMLIQKLKELQENELLKFTNYPRILTSQILSDWVFTQYPLLLKDVVKIIINGINIGSILSQDQESRFASNEPIILPIECGRNELILECFEQLKTFPLIDYANELIGIIKNNPCNTIQLWSNYTSEIEGEKLNIWLEYGYKMQILHKLNDTFLKSIVLKDDTYLGSRLQMLINAGKLIYIEENKGLKEVVFQKVLDNSIVVFHRQYSGHSLKFLSQCLRIQSLTSIIKSDEPNLPYFQVTNNKHTYYYRENMDSLEDFKIIDEYDEKIDKFKKKVIKYLSTNLSVWKNKIEPWDCLVENGRKLFNNHWIFSIIAVIGAGIKSKEERFDDFSDLDDNSQSLCKRIRNARLKSGSTKFWEIELNARENLDVRLLIFFTWATPKVIVSLLPMLSSVIDLLPSSEFNKLKNALRQIASISYFTPTQQQLVETAIAENNVSDSLKLILSFRVLEETKGEFLYRFTEDKPDSLQVIINSKLNYLIDTYLEQPEKIHLLKLIQSYYEKLAKFSNRSIKYTRRNNRESTIIPIEIAKEIMIDCKKYPRIIALFAERSCRMYAFKNTKPVGEIAKTDLWFN